MKAALVTGASTGIGKELAIEHARHGGNVVIVARSERPLKDLKTKLEEEFDVKAFVIAKDLTTDNAAKELFDEVAELGIQLDCLMNNAGAGEIGKFEEAELSIYQLMMQLNMNVLTELCYYFVHHVEENKSGGEILNVASTASFQAIPNMAVYAASKAYVLSLSESLAIELKKKNINVTVLCPGPTKTEFSGNANVSDFAENLPIFASAEEVAKFGYKKMKQDQTIAIPGLLNRIGAGSSKLLPRKGVSTILGKIMDIGSR